ncbi:MAG TPA: hypothetical protein VF120_03805 [Ktedonobacterales bacterium]|jgi:hypothetical protein
MLPFSTPDSNAVPMFPAATLEGWSTLQRLRTQYQQNLDLWTERELAHLLFMRWLVETGRLADDGGSPENGTPGRQEA